MNSSIRDRSRERLREEERDNSSRSQRDRARDRDSSENGDRDPKKDNLDHYDGSRSRGHGEMLRDEYRRRGYDDDGGRDDHRKRERDKSRRDNNSRNPHLERDNEINDRDTKRGNSSVKNDSKQQASSTNYDRLKPRLEAFAKLLTGTNKSNIRRDLEQSVKANVKLQAVNIQHQAAQSSQGAVVKDSYSRGVKPDLVSDRYNMPLHVIPFLKCI